MLQYTEEQLAAIEKVQKWYEEGSSKVFEFTGYAGTGKTTVIKELIRRLNLKNVRFAAYTGKASRVIQKASGFPSSTIHSLIYTLNPVDKKLCDSLYAQLHGNDPVTDPGERRRLEKELEEASSLNFSLRSLEQTDLLDTDLLVLDECSMVGEDMVKDLVTFGVPILALGDPGQLPPPQEKPGLFLGKPDVFLTEIHRQAADSPIIKNSILARKGIPWAFQEGERFTQQPLEKDPKKEEEKLVQAGQILCGMNKTRTALNVRMRKLKGFDATNPFPQVGETLCCWRNDKEKGLFTGDQGTVVEVGNIMNLYIELYIQFDHLAEPIWVKALRAYFEEYFRPGELKKVKWYEKKNVQEFDFGYCVTVHKAQGSQWENVVYIDDGLFRGWRAKKNERNKLQYTAITRASESFTCYVS